MKTRRLLDPIAALELRKTAARVVSIEISADLREFFAATTFGVLRFAVSVSREDLEVDFTVESCD